MKMARSSNFNKDISTVGANFIEDKKILVGHVHIFNTNYCKHFNIFKKLNYYTITQSQY